jgi:hypothetical protein
MPIQNSVLLSSNQMELACRDGFLRAWNDLDSVLHLQLCRNVLLFSISQTFFNVETCISQKILTTKIITGIRIIWKRQNLYLLCNSKVCVLYWHRCFLRVLNFFLSMWSFHHCSIFLLWRKIKHLFIGCDVYFFLQTESLNYTAWSCKLFFRLLNSFWPCSALLCLIILGFYFRLI